MLGVNPNIIAAIHPSTAVTSRARRTAAPSKCGRTWRSDTHWLNISEWIFKGLYWTSLFIYLLSIYLSRYIYIHILISKHIYIHTAYINTIKCVYTYIRIDLGFPFFPLHVFVEDTYNILQPYFSAHYLGFHPQRWVIRGQGDSWGIT